MLPKDELPGGFEMKGTITIIAGGKTFQEEIGGEELFTATLRQAMRNGKNSIRALKYLADEGAKNWKHQSQPGRQNAIGD